jgi:hypothetical protein
MHSVYFVVISKIRIYPKLRHDQVACLRATEKRFSRRYEATDRRRNGCDTHKSFFFSLLRIEHIKICLEVIFFICRKVRSLTCFNLEVALQHTKYLLIL